MVLHAVYVQKMLHVMDVAQRNVRIMFFVKKYGEEKLLDCLERNEKNGIVYHREGIHGDYDEFDDIEKLMDFIMTGRLTFQGTRYLSFERKPEEKND